MDGMRARMRRLRGDRKGIAAVEFAFVSLMFIMLILGSIEMVIMMQGYSVLQASIAQAARVVMTNPTTSQLQAMQAAENHAALSGYTSPKVVFTAKFMNCSDGSYTKPFVIQCTEITGTYTHTFTLGFFGVTSIRLRDSTRAPQLE